MPVHAKPDSQDVCFLEGDDYRALDALRRRIAASRRVRHDHRRDGRHARRDRRATRVGQRRGLPPTHTNDGPRYVVRIEPDSNVVVIGREDELGAAGLVADDVNLIRPERFGADATPVLAMTRYRAPLARATAT